MSLLPDWKIEELCSHPLHPMVTPFDLEMLNPASLDIRVGDSAIITTFSEYWGSHTRTVQLGHTTERNPLFVRWPSFILVGSLETFDIPVDVSAQFVLKSSRAREGWNHSLAGFADPGWHGSKLTMELSVAKPGATLPLYYGMRIGQMKFAPMVGVPRKDYSVTGRYNNDTSVQESKG